MATWVGVEPLGAAVESGQVDTTYGQAGLGYVSPEIAAFSRDHAARMVRDTTSGRMFSVFEAVGPGGQDPVIGVVALGATGDPDPGFGTGGFAAFDPTLFGETPLSATVDSAGRLVIAGRATPNGLSDGDRPLLARILTNGSLDTTFGYGGVMVGPPAAPGSVGSLDAVALDESGRIVVAGTLPLAPVTIGGTTYYGSDGFVSRYQANGTLDSTFGSGGVAAVHAADFTFLWGLSIDGPSIYASGGTSSQTSSPRRYDAVVARLDSDGFPDPAWAGTGIMVIPGATISGSTVTTTGATIAGSVATDADHRVYVAGDGGFSNRIWMYRFNTDGSGDTTWGTGGAGYATYVADGRRLSSLAILTDGSAVTSGYAVTSSPNRSEVLIARFDASGVPDSAFGGGDGIATVTRPLSSGSPTEQYEVGGGGVVDASGGFWTISAADGPAATAAYGDKDGFVRHWDVATGALDTSFNAGAFQVDFGSYRRAPSSVYGMGHESSGRLVLAGDSARNAYQHDFAVGVLTPTGFPDLSFGPTGGRAVDFGSEYDAAYDADFTPDGGVIAVGGTLDAMAMARWTPTGALDTTWGNNGVLLDTSGSYSNAFAVRAILDGSAVVAAELDGLASVIRLTPSGQPDPSFGTNGTATLPFSSPSWSPSALDIDVATNRLAVVGQGSSGTAAVSVLNLTTGAPVTSFNGTGTALADVPSGDDTAASVTFTSDDKVVVGGAFQITSPPNSRQFAARFLPNGALDSSFGNSGIATWDGGNSGAGNRVSGLAVDGAGHLLVAGQAQVGNYYDATVTRLTTAGTLDGAFATGGILDLGAGSGSTQEIAVNGVGSRVMVGFGAAASMAAVAITNSGVIAAPPSTTSITPNSAQACTTGCSPVTVTVNGSGFDESSVVWWDTDMLTPTSQTPTTLTVLVPAAFLAASATHQIRVTSSAGGSSALPFFVTETAATILSSDTTSGTNPTASTGDDGATVTASAAGDGTVTVAQYESNPVSSPAPAGTSNFFDIHVPTGNNFTSLTVVDCALADTNTSHLIYWWTGSQWEPVSNQVYNDGCVTMTFNGFTSPMILQLTGTVFADTPADQRTVSVGPANTEGILSIAPGDWLSAGYEFKPVGKTKKPTTVSLTDARLVLPVSCGNGTTGNQLVVDLAPRTYSLPAGSTAWMPTNDNNAPAGFQGAVQITDPCNGTGITTTTAGATLTATISTLPAGTPLSVAFHYRDPQAKRGQNISCADPSTNPAPGVKSCTAGWSTPAMM